MTKVKLYFIVISLGLLCLYMILPMGAYGIDDVNAGSTGNIISAFTPLSLPPEEWADNASGSANPKVSKIVIPITGVSRDGKTTNITARVNSGLKYFGDIDKEGATHGALDIFVNDKLPTHYCEFNPNCPDVALIAPFSGIVSEVKYLGDGANHYSHYNVKDAQGGCTSIVSIQGEGEWSGYTARVMHFTGLNPNIKKGSKIEQGDFIGFLCSQGNSTAPHLHYDMFQGTKKLDNPTAYMDNLIWHSSIQKAVTYDALKIPGESGFSKKQFEDLGDRERYTSVVNIPSKYKK